MERKVAIVGHAQTKHSSDIGVPRPIMLYRLVKSLYEEMGITRYELHCYPFTDGACAIVLGA